MYDYVKVTNSINRMAATLIYTEPQGGIVQVDYIYDKELDACVKVTTPVMGDKFTEKISKADFCFEYGKAVGEMSNGLPRN